MKETYERVQPGQPISEISQEKGCNEEQHASTKRRKEGEMKGILTGSLWPAVLVRVLPVVLLLRTCDGWASFDLDERLQM